MEEGVKEIEITFEREGLHGIVAVGSYIRDAAKRFGIKQEAPCDTEKDLHYCAVTLSSGADLLSPLTEAEKRYFAEIGGDANERLGCQARFDKEGEVEVVTQESEKEAPTVDSEKPADDDYLKAFADLPLDKKIADLVKLEAMALGDTLAYIANTPYTVAEKVMDVLAGFGFERHEKEKEAERPKEHAAHSKKKKDKHKAKEPKGPEATVSEDQP